MNRLMRQLNLADVVVDPDDQDSKHDSIRVREARSNWQAGTRQQFITARMLDRWLISDWQHKRRHMKLPDLPFEPVRSGLFYSLRLGGTWVAADWWLQYFSVDDSTIALRLENLVEDFNHLMLPFLPANTPPLQSAPKDNAKPSNIKLAEEPIFSQDDLKRIHTNNPRWSSWQQKIYP